MKVEKLPILKPHFLLIYEYFSETNFVTHLATNKIVKMLIIKILSIILMTKRQQRKSDENWWERMLAFFKSSKCQFPDPEYPAIVTVNVGSSKGKW